MKNIKLDSNCELIPTIHYVERYCQRELKIDCPKEISNDMIRNIKKDMMNKINNRELKALSFFSNTKKFEIPIYLMNNKKIVIKNKHLITILPSTKRI